ncbi:hypothetical protein pVco14_045 [Vibrio phage pVco-14]|nr:hypothetical protein pVco14_045 [Vibrio phage pVco-14]
MVKNLKCNGGPYSGRTLTLTSPESGTLPFSLKGFKGHYKYNIRELGYPNGKQEELLWVSTQ